MASAHCATISFFTPLANTTRRGKLVVLSSISIPSPSKLTKRRNYLRPKLLKTLKKPYPTFDFPPEPAAEPVIPNESPHEKPPECPADQLPTDFIPTVTEEEFNVEQYEEIRTSGAPEAIGALDTNAGKFSTGTFVKYGLYLVGAFVFQTICAVWIFGSVNSDHKDGKLESGNKNGVLELEKSELLLNGGDNSVVGDLGFNLYVDKSELEGKIVEIQAMARDVRERERLGTTESGLSDEDDDDDDVFKTGIGKEVDTRLIKLKKKLGKDREKLAIPLMKEANEDLMFKKKYKIRNSDLNPRSQPKGFGGSETKTESGNLASGDRMGANGSNHVEPLDKLDLSNGRSQVKDSVTLEEVPLTKPSREGLSSSQTVKRNSGKEKRRKKSGKNESTELEAHNSRSSAKDDVLQTNASLKPKKIGLKQANQQTGDKKSEAENDLWWLSVPYVMAILMRRGVDDEGPQGLFTIKNPARTEDERGSSYTVAFEDRADATNFCYILHSFFEDLGDFSADIIPLPTEELEEGVKSHTMKLIVVGKGQLKLYAGQPLTDVEMALLSLVK